MAKFYGAVGYGLAQETKPGVFEVHIEERNYYGDVVKDAHHWENSENLNDNLKLANRVSIVADAYAYEHASAIRYVSWMGAKWKVSEFYIQCPRIILSLGGVYNGDEA